MQENLAANLCLLLGENGSIAEQWKLLGQEKDGSLLLGWIAKAPTKGSDQYYSVVGCYNRLKDDLQILHTFKKTLNLIQATVNQNRTLLGYVIKQKVDYDSNEYAQANDEMRTKDEANENVEEQYSNRELEYYQAYIITIKTEKPCLFTLEHKKLKQVRIQFLYKDKLDGALDKLLLLVHQEYVQMCKIFIDVNSDEHKVNELKKENLVKSFIWAQWDANNQVLYHIHNRKASSSVFTEDCNEKSHKPPCASPMLSSFQFHDNLPHETVLNIPLNLPQSPNSDNCGTYEDDVIPLRIHDCSLDLIIVSDYQGAVCICHHYLYRPAQLSQHILDSDSNNTDTVHFAYSVTLLHHSCVIHCVVPEIPWDQAKLMRPTFSLYGNNHMVVFVQDFFTHLLEIGLHHQPCCHILCGPLPNIPSQSSYLVPLLNLFSDNNESKQKNALTNSSTNILTVDLPTLDLVTLTVPNYFLINAFKKEINTDIRLSVLHYFFCHKNDLEVVAELIMSLAEKPRAVSVVKIMQEFLVGGSHSLVQKNLLSDALPLLSLIPVTMLEECSTIEAKVNNWNIKLSHEKLLNTTVMLLSPRQRLVPYQNDLWTRLWDLLGKRNDELPRFQSKQTAEKLQISLACYQPEALSRCTTPMSPNGGFAMATATLGDLMGGRHKYTGDSALPFVEIESCTASRQEHVISVNLRELSLHLLKYGSQSVAGTNVRSKAPSSSCTPLHVHAMTSRYVATQLETSRLLCQMICKAANVDPKIESDRGFSLVDRLDDSRRWMLFTLLERYRHAAESVAYPLPQGFMSFFTYLGYRTLNYTSFLRYLRHSVFELQVDVAKVIMADIDDSRGNLSRKLELLTSLPRSRAKRLLNQWLHPVSFMLRAREHSANILCGELSQSRGRPPQHRQHHNGLAAFPSTDRLSPLDTFLDLLTAKASLTELDFGLLIEATVTSTEDFL